MEISSPLVNTPPISRRRCEGFDEVEEDAPLWMQYLVPTQSTSSFPENETSEDPTPTEISLDQHIYRDHDLDEKPLWMRYLPNNKIIPKAQDFTGGTIQVGSSSSGPTSMRKKIILKRSLNPFGPTSAHAVTVENPIQAANRKRSMDGVVNEGDDEEGASADKLSPRKFVKSSRQRTVNMSEAAELFSIVKIK